VIVPIVALLLSTLVRRLPLDVGGGLGVMLAVIGNWLALMPPRKVTPP
jgi:hypothetical protein